LVAQDDAGVVDDGSRADHQPDPRLRELMLRALGDRDGTDTLPAHIRVQRWEPMSLRVHGPAGRRPLYSGGTAENRVAVEAPDMVSGLLTMEVLYQLS
jgi:hypothetical protein